MIKARVLHMSNARQIDSANKGASTYKSTSKEREKMEICLNCTKISCKRGYCEQLKEVGGHGR